MTARIAPMLSYGERERESSDTKTENSFIFVITYLSLNTKSGYKDFRSLSFLIDVALSFAVFIILITPQALHVL